MTKSLMNLVAEAANAQSPAAVEAFANTRAGKQVLESAKLPAGSSGVNIIEAIAKLGAPEKAVFLKLIQEFGVKMKKGDSLVIQQGNAALAESILTVNGQPMVLSGILAKYSDVEKANRNSFGEPKCDPAFTSRIATKIGWAEEEVRRMITSGIVVSQASCSVDGDGKNLEDYGTEELTVLFKAAKEFERVLAHSKKEITDEVWAKAILTAQGKKANQAAILAETASVIYLKDHCHLLGKYKM